MLSFFYFPNIVVTKKFPAIFSVLTGPMELKLAHSTVLMIRFCLYSDIMSDHAKFELTFTKVGTIYDTYMHAH